MAEATENTTGFNLAIVQGADVEFARLNTNNLEVIGIAKLNDKLYAVCVSNDTIFEFDDHDPYGRTRTFTVAGMSPGDLIADSDIRKLYVIDWRSADQGGTHIWCVDPATGNSVHHVDARHWTGTMSLTPNRRILGVLGSGVLNLCDSTAELTSLQLPASIACPQHAVETKRGTFYVSQGWTDGQAHLVSEVDSTATTMLHQFGANALVDRTLNWPRHLAYCAEGLFVADYWNRRVLKLSENLTLVDEVLRHDPTENAAVGWPNRLLIDRQSKLYIAMAERPLQCH